MFRNSGYTKYKQLNRFDLTTSYTTYHFGKVYLLEKFCLSPKAAALHLRCFEKLTLIRTASTSGQTRIVVTDTDFVTVASDHFQFSYYPLNSGPNLLEVFITRFENTHN